VLIRLSEGQSSGLCDLMEVTYRHKKRASE
jgi:hypothetical protein